jgi:hypothetical protein
MKLFIIEPTWWSLHDLFQPKIVEQENETKTYTFLLQSHMPSGLRYFRPEGEELYQPQKLNFLFPEHYTNLSIDSS